MIAESIFTLALMGVCGVIIYVFLTHADKS